MIPPNDPHTASSRPTESPAKATQATLKEARLFDEPTRLSALMVGLQLAPRIFGPGASIEPDPFETPVESERVATGVGGLSCSTCQCQFENHEAQRQHFKLDWHRYNLRSALDVQPSITEDEFERLLDNWDKLSLSGSEGSQTSESSSDNDDDESSDEEEDQPADSEAGLERQTELQHRHPRVFFRNDQDRVYSIHKCVLLTPKEDQREVSETEMLARLGQARLRLKWAVFMLGGGHFAGAIFNGGQVGVHKTFHCYTVRAKQGGSQGMADQKKGGRHPKSAGASLRRYNEAALVQHVQELVRDWASDLAQCHLIFYRAPSGNRRVLFHGQDPPLDKSDPRLRSIPFATKRATFTEVKRVHATLSTIRFHGEYEALAESAEGLQSGQTDILLSQRRGGKKRKKINPGIHRSKSREIKQRPWPDIVQEVVEGAGSSEGDTDLGHQTLSPLGSESHLEEFANSTMKGKRHRRKKFQTPHMPTLDPDIVPADTPGNSLDHVENRLITACKSGNLQLFRSVLEDADDIAALLNKPFGTAKQTALHLASNDGQKALVKALLENGANPSTKDRAKKVPFFYCSNKETRNTYKQFRKTYPDRYDYSQSGIPLPATDEAEQRQKDKMKAKKQARKEKEKATREVEKQVKLAEAERQRFSNLSDREKRALAAERRILLAKEASGETKPVLLRCFQCGRDISGQVPFEYEVYRFCSVSCLKSHRGKITQK